MFGKGGLTLGTKIGSVRSEEQKKDRISEQ